MVVGVAQRGRPDAPARRAPRDARRPLAEVRPHVELDLLGDPQRARRPARTAVLPLRATDSISNSQVVAVGAGAELDLARPPCGRAAWPAGTRSRCGPRRARARSRGRAARPGTRRPPPSRPSRPRRLDEARDLDRRGRVGVAGDRARSAPRRDMRGDWRTTTRVAPAQDGPAPAARGWRSEGSPPTGRSARAAIVARDRALLAVDPGRARRVAPGGAAPRRRPTARRPGRGAQVVARARRPRRRSRGVRPTRRARAPVRPPRAVPPRPGRPSSAQRVGVLRGRRRAPRTRRARRPAQKAPAVPTTPRSASSSSSSDSGERLATRPFILRRPIRSTDPDREHLQPRRRARRAGRGSARTVPQPASSSRRDVVEQPGRVAVVGGVEHPGATSAAAAVHDGEVVARGRRARPGGRRWGGRGRSVTGPSVPAAPRCEPGSGSRRRSAGDHRVPRAHADRAATRRSGIP